jgi:hypothetical protein
MRSNLPRLAILATVLFFAAGLQADAELQAELLVGLPWSSPEELTEIASGAHRVRYVTRGKVVIDADRDALAQLQSRGITPLFTDESGPDDAYFLVAYRSCPLHAHTVPVYKDPDGWALLRLQPGDREYTLPHFLYLLPEAYSIEGWMEPTRRAKPTSPLDVATMAEILAQVDAERLETDIRTLALKDPQAPSERDNLRTRFTVRPETFEATEYIRSELAAVLGEGAVEIQEFEVDPVRLSSHLKGKVGDEPVDARAYNVVGLLPGTDPEAGYYVICGHYDATGVRSANWDWRTDPAPGADDNATGAALILESARVLARQRFPWSIRFIAFSGEELGLLGSRNYAGTAAAEGDAVLGVLNFDMFGYNDLIDRVEVATNPASRWLADLMVGVNEQYNIGLQVDVLEDEGARLSDHASFWARGYDAVLAIENYLPNDPDHPGVSQGLYRINAQYHSIADVPDSINWGLVHKITQLAVASLSHYGQAEGQPNLAVFTGDLQPGEDGELRMQVSNIGTGLSAEPFRVRLSHCGADSTDCELIYDEERVAELAPGQVMSFAVPWLRLGQATFLLEVDSDDRIAEESETDNSAFQQLYLQPRERIAVYPNPYRPQGRRPLVFAGVPLKARVRIFTPGGELVWSGLEDDSEQRKLNARAGEVLWNGVNESGLLVNSGIYIYTIDAADGNRLERDKIAVVR